MNAGDLKFFINFLAVYCSYFGNFCLRLLHWDNLLLVSSSFTFHLCIYIFKILAFCSYMLQIYFVHFFFNCIKRCFQCTELFSGEIYWFFSTKCLYVGFPVSISSLVKVKVLVAQSHLIICNLMDCSPSGSSVHGILQARILEWIAIPFSRASAQPRDWTWLSCIAGRFFTFWATKDILLNSTPFGYPLEQWSPTFLAPETGFIEDNIFTDQGGGNCFRMIQEHYFYCVLYFYYYYFSSISDCQVLDPGGWGSFSRATIIRGFTSLSQSMDTW